VHFGLLSLLLALTLFQPSAGAITGIVVDARSGTPLRRVSVRLQTDGRAAVTGDDGRFDITDVRAGDHELYVSAVDFLLVKKVVTVTAAAATDVVIALSPGTTYSENVTVLGAAPAAPRHEPEVAAEQILANTELQQLRGLLTNDPMRAVQMLPGVATGDDFRSEFAVRGLSVRDMNVTFEGVSSPFLVHTVQNFPESGSVAMVNGDVLDEMSLLNGTYPQRHGDRLGAELGLRLREGSRDGLHSRVSVSMTDAAIVFEGPLGRAKRGSWLTSVRRSYLDFVLRQISAAQGVAFGFEDAQTKLVYDVSPHHQVQVAVTSGRSALVLQPDSLDGNDLQKGVNGSTVAVATWRYLPSPRVALYQRAGFTVNQFHNTTKGGVALDRGRSDDLLYRTDWTFSHSAGVTSEGGAEIRASSIHVLNRVPSGATFRVVDDFTGSSTAISAYEQSRWVLKRGATMTPGVRVDHWSLTGHTAVSPWAVVSWPLPLRGSVLLRGGSGVYWSDPGFVETLGARGSRGLDAPYAWTIDAGLEGRFLHGLRWQINWYNREDRRFLRLPRAEQHLVNGRYVSAVQTTRYMNTLDGTARGGELVLRRRSPNGLSGWISYAYGQNRYDDLATGESFWGDYDQRHTVNMFGMYRFSDRLSASARFRGGTNFPAPGYFREEAGINYLNDVRNTLWIPNYQRLDVRANRTFNWEQKRLTLYMEALNLFAHHNVRFGIPSVDRRTFIASDMFDSTFPLVPSVGLLLEF
jgi:hypothetical protein